MRITWLPIILFLAGCEAAPPSAKTEEDCTLGKITATNEEPKPSTTEKVIGAAAEIVAEAAGNRK